MSKLFYALSVFSLAFLIACGGCSKKVSRIDASSTTDLSGKWNDTDSRLVATEMINDCLSRPWYNKVSQELGRNPTVVVGKVKNKSHEHISVETFTKDMERALINSGLVDFVANAEARSELRAEVADQMGNASADTQIEAGQETGANLMLTGTINSIIDQEGGHQVIFYQIDMELIDLKTHKKLWIGDKKIKKDISNASVKM